MPKRPCAVALTLDEKTILCADKFGDVYSLPLIMNAEADGSLPKNCSDQTSGASYEDAEIPFVPAANSRTVHTLRNQKALENQKKITNRRARKKTPEFDHRLLLGHVSLLTDLVCVSLQDHRFNSPKPRNYILTSDRDEHIRVSRGIPQAHIIEGYCLGHSEFVTKLCIPNWYPQLLISGGGDDYLLLWDWLSGRVRQVVDLRSPLLEFKKECGLDQNGGITTPASQVSKGLLGESVNIFDTRIAVSGIWALQRSDSRSKAHQGEIFVACER